MNERVARIAKSVVAIPHVKQVRCVRDVDSELFKRLFKGRPKDGADVFAELYGTGKLPEEYEDVLEKHFGTKDKKQITFKAYWAEEVPVLCPDGEIRVVDQKTGKTLKVLKRIESGI